MNNESIFGFFVVVSDDKLVTSLTMERSKFLVSEDMIIFLLFSIFGEMNVWIDSY